MESEELSGQKIDCFLCGAELPIRIDKNGKAYLVCNDCEIQIFVRGQSGRDRLIDKAVGFDFSQPFKGVIP